jgi:hypothetical protein
VLGEGDAPGEGLGTALGDALGGALGDALGPADGLGVALGDGAGGPADGLGVTLGDALGLGAGGGDGDGEGGAGQGVASLGTVCTLSPMVTTRVFGLLGTVGVVPTCDSLAGTVSVPPRSEPSIRQDPATGKGSRLSPRQRR